jgi:hypothetical protein
MIVDVESVERILVSILGIGCYYHYMMIVVVVDDDDVAMHFLLGFYTYTIVMMMI